MTIIDYSSIEDNSVIESDICIIGSGMSAQILASSIKNKKIIMIESGKLEYEKNIQSLNEYDEMCMLFRKDHINRVRQLGGSANLWANQLMILKNFEIKNRDWITKDFSWPFNSDELKSYYDDVIKLIYNKNFKYINILDEYRNNLFLEKEFLKIDEFELLQSFWPSEVEKFNNKSKFTKKILASKNIEFYEFFTATKIEVDEETESIKSIKVKSQNKACTIKSNFYVWQVINIMGEMGEGGMNFLLNKKGVGPPEFPRGDLRAEPTEMTGLKSIEGFSDIGLVAEEVAKQPDTVHGYTSQERKMGQGYGEGYDGGGVFHSHENPSDLSNISNDSEFEDPIEAYSEEMENIPVGNMKELMRPYFKMDAGVKQRKKRKEAYNLYKKKIQKQRANPKIRYKSRKTIADNRPRVKGRFVKTEDKVKAGKSKKLTKARKKSRTKAKRDLMKAKKSLKRALARYNKVMKM